MEQVRPGTLPYRLASRSRTRRPLVSGFAIGVAGYLAMTVLLVGLGLLLTKVLLDGPVGSWDRGLDRWFFLHRTPTFNAITEWGTRVGDVAAVVVVAALAVGILAIGRHWPHIAFLVGALVIEVTTFVTTTFVIDRQRPAVPHLDPGPPTFVAFSRLYRGMHHPTDVIGSVIGAFGCLAFAFLATRTGVAVDEANERAASEDSQPRALAGEGSPVATAPAPSSRSTDVEVSP
jgi:hypothetical protein